MKKKFLSLALALSMLMCTVPAYADVAEDVEAGEAMTHEELVEKAQAESGTFVVYGNTSRITTAAEKFGAQYGIPFESNNLKDQEIYTKLRNETGNSAADMVMIQDGAQLTDAIDEAAEQVEDAAEDAAEFVGDAVDEFKPVEDPEDPEA